MLSDLAWIRLETKLLGEQGLAVSTTGKTIRSLQFMERHGFPVQQPTAQQYARFAAKRRREGATGTSLSHCRKAVRRLFVARGIDPPRLAPARVPKPEIRVLGDDVVDRIMNVMPPDVDDAELESLRFSLAFGFYTALRSPSEPVTLDLANFDDHTGELSVFSPKTRRSDVLDLEPWLAEIVRAYIAGPRDRLAAHGERALLVNADKKSRRRGERWRREAFRMWKARAGKLVSRSYHNYAERHWGLTYRAIEWDLDILLVQEWARHADVSQTMRYIHVAEKILRKRRRAKLVRPLSLSLVDQHARAAGAGEA